MQRWMASAAGGTSQRLKPGTVRHAFMALAKEGLVHIRHGRTTTIAGESAAEEPATRLQITRPRPGHDCKLSGCRPHVCKPMAKGTSRGIHAILSGAFEAAMRWEWTDRNPAASARPPTPSRRTILATSPEDVAKVARSYTGQYLKTLFKKHNSRRPAAAE